MHVLITGAAGLIGSRLAREILRRGTFHDDSGAATQITRLTLLDIAPIRVGEDDPRVERVVGTVSDASLLRRIIEPETAGVFHLAAVVSGGAEADFALGYGSNLDGLLALLQACRTLSKPPRLVFSSSIAVYGGALPAKIPDEFPLRPHISYGVQKAAAELLIGDYSRKGFIDGRCLRLPTVVVRPGQGNAANSGFVSAIVREPLAGREAICPVAAETPMTLISTRRTVAALLHGFALPAAAWGWNRLAMLPSLDVPIGALAEAVRRVAGEEAFRRILWRRDPDIEALVAAWPKGFAAERAAALGFTADVDTDEIVRSYLSDAA